MTKIVVATHCRICDMPLNTYNKTGICLHGHWNTGRESDEKAGAVAIAPQQSPQKEKLVSAMPRIVAVLSEKEEAYAENLMHAACAIYGVTRNDIVDKESSGIFVEVRRVIMYMAYRDGLRAKKIAAFLNRHPSSAAQGFARIRLLIMKDGALADCIRRIQELALPL